MDIKEKVLTVLKSVREDIDFEKEKALIDDSLLDSFDIVGIVSELSDTFDITIEADELTAENFNSADTMAAMIERIINGD